MSDQAAASPLTLAVDRSGNAAAVRCSGRMVAGVNDRLFLEVSPLIPSLKRILLDLTDLTQMDSSGLGTLVRSKTCPQDRQAALCNSSTLRNRFGNFLALPVFCRCLRWLATTTSGRMIPRGCDAFLQRNDRRYRTLKLPFPGWARYISGRIKRN